MGKNYNVSKTTWGLSLLILFILFSLGIRNGILSSFDLASMKFIQYLIPKDIDMPLSLFSLLGSFEVITAILCIVLFTNKRIQRIYVLLLYAAGLSIEIVGKTFIHHPPPPPIFFRYTLPFLFPSSLYKTGFSYPSGHAIRSVFLAIVLWHVVKQSVTSVQMKLGMKITIVACMSTMLISRVSLGEHWTSDVIAGLLLGSGLGFTSISQDKKREY